MDPQKRQTRLVKWMGRVSNTEMIVMLYRIDTLNANHVIRALCCTLHQYATFLWDASV